MDNENTKRAVTPPPVGDYLDVLEEVHDIRRLLDMLKEKYPERAERIETHGVDAMAALWRVLETP